MSNNLPYGPSHFVDPLLRSLGSLSGQDSSKTVPCDDVIQEVFEREGIEENEYGINEASGQPQARRWVLSAAQKLRDQDLAASPKRGHWKITEEGIAALRKQHKQEAAERAGVDLSPESAGIPYRPAKRNLPTDPRQREVLLLQTETTACFGYHRAGHDECSKCHLSNLCQVEQARLLKEISGRMDHEHEINMRYQRVHDAITKGDGDLEAATAELVEMVEEEGNMPSGTALSLSCPTFTLCYVCGGVIEPTQHCHWTAGKGAHHVTCKP